MTTEPRGPTMKRVPELDGLRALAASAVIAFHLWPESVPLGWVGVDLFFVMSGFLITGIILEKGRGPGFFVPFYARRNLRIWPTYFLVVGVLVTLGLRPHYGEWYFWAYLQNTPLYLSPGTATAFEPAWAGMDHTWTLAVEEQFYLLWPVLVLAARRRVLLLCLVTAAVSVLARSAGLSNHLLASHADPLAAGAALAVVRRDGLPERDGMVGFAGAALWAACWAWYGTAAVAAPAGWLGVVLPPGLAAVFYAAVASVSRNGGGRALAPLRWPPLAYLGSISYGLYLYHLPVLLAARPARFLATGTLPGLWRLDPYVPDSAVVIALTLVTAVVSWHWVERPVLSLKRFFEYRDGTDAARA